MFNFSADQFNTANMPLMQTVAAQILNLQIELDDTQYGREDSAGVHSYNRYLPLNKVVLSNSSFDGDANNWDFANGIVTETIIGSMGVQGAPAVFVAGFRRRSPFGNRVRNPRGDVGPGPRQHSDARSDCAARQQPQRRCRHPSSDPAEDLGRSLSKPPTDAGPVTGPGRILCSDGLARSRADNVAQDFRQAEQADHRRDEVDPGDDRCKARSGGKPGL